MVSAMVLRLGTSARMRARGIPWRGEETGIRGWLLGRRCRIGRGANANRCSAVERTRTCGE
jgi:hypothetical protein